jgi:aminoglycoside 6'-N-acetyltransferase I
VSEFRIRTATPADCEQLSRLREALWPESSAEEHARELASSLITEKSGSMPLAIFVAEAPGGLLAGFLEAGLRSHADGCDPGHPVGFVEGWFVLESHRGKGTGARLLAAAEDWARSHGCIEMASDTWINHDLSQRVHEALGFEVVDRCVHYRKAL